VILVRAETSPEDVAGMHAAQGVLTRVGLTSHAAVVARGWGKSCVVGAGAWWWTRKADSSAGTDGRARRQVVTLNGATGEFVWVLAPGGPDALPGVREGPRVGRQVSTTKVRATPHSRGRRQGPGVQGCRYRSVRTEHMFFKADRIAIVRR